MDVLRQVGDTIALYFESNTELALWTTIALTTGVLLLIMLTWPAFRRFMGVVIVISIVLGALLVNFGEEVARRF